MPFDNQGTFTRVKTWQQEVITFADHNDEDADFATALNQTFIRDGRVPMSGDLNVNDHKITNLKDAVAMSDAINKGQLESVQMTLQENIDTKFPADKIKVVQSLPADPDPTTYYFVIG